MSLILEALRKSEAERRRAQVPDLLAEAQPAAPIAMRAAPKWPLAFGAAIVIAGLAWFTLRDRAPDATETTIAATNDDTDASAPAIDSAVQATPTPQPVAPPRVQRPLVIAPPAAAPAPATTRTATPAAIAVADALPPPPKPLPAPPPPVPVARDTYERVADLGPDERKSLPPLKLSMHMWNDDQGQRFVIIDGARLVVGDRLGALVVADILPDGVVLDWNGRALKLPLR